jgi:zinc protease
MGLLRIEISLLLTTKTFFLILIFALPLGCQRMNKQDTMNASPVTKVVLDNKMTVLVKEIHSAPVVAINTLVKVGYFDEPDSLTGISHLLEHMFFKGTKKRKVGQLRDETRSLGGYLNGGTIYENTNYYTVLPQRFVQEGLELQSDALLNSVIDSVELEKEKKVVIQEIKRKLDNPDALAWEKLMELAFQKHPIRRWRIGTETQIAGFRQKDLENHYLGFYRPDNVILTIVGDIKTEEVLKAVEDYYGDFIKESTEKKSTPSEIKQKEFKYAQLNGDITQTYLKIGFHIPAKLACSERSEPNQDFFALDVLSHILGHGRSSRLSQVLKEKKNLVTSIKSEAFGLKDIGVLTIEAELEAKDLLPAEVQIFREIEKLKISDVYDSELAKAKNVMKFSHLSSIETAMGYAENLAFFESYGDFRLADEYLENVEKVTKADIKKVAFSYLRLDGASLLEYRPNRDFDEKITATMIKDSIKESLKEEMGEVGSEKLTLVKSDEKGGDISSTEFVSEIGSAYGGKKARKEKLAGGATLITRGNHSLPLVSLGIYFKGGRIYESPSNCGITQLTLRTGLKGTQSKSAYEISSLMEMLGASIDLEVNADYFGYRVKLLSQNIADGLEIISDVVKNPVFENEELEKEKNILLAEIKKNKDSMADYPIDLFYQAIFPHHPYGLNSLGESKALNSLNRGEVVDWYNRFFGANNIFIVAVGDFDSEKLKEELNKNFRDFRKVEIPTSEAIEVKREEGEKMVVEDRAKSQTAQALGFVTCSYRDSDLYPLKVLQAIASGGGGRFFNELREKRSLAYTVYGNNDSWGKAGVFYTYIATSPEKEAESKQGLLNEFYKFKTALVDDNEIGIAKRYITGVYQILLETNSALVKQYAKAELLGKGIGEIEKYPQKINQVTREQIKNVAIEYFNEKNLAVGVIRGKP